MAASGLMVMLGLMLDGLALPVLHLIIGPQVDMFIAVLMAWMHAF